MVFGVTPLSLDFEKLAQFSRHENKRICHQDRHIDQGKDQVELHFSSKHRVARTLTACLIKK
jgi:hypothetical protein